MPMQLAEADPPALRSCATRHRDDADAATQQAQALRTAVVRLVPVAWLGLGSLAFAQAALLQAAALDGIASACADLAATVDALAARLEEARSEAQTAVGAAHRLDEEVAADNAAWSRRPEPERTDPDPDRIAAQDAMARSLAIRLELATEIARQAWLHAGAAFDLVAYRMPDLAARMSDGPDDGWRPSAALTALPDGARRRLLGVSPVCIGAGWAGSGAVTGPDGRRYPLVVPWVEQNGVRWTADGDTATGTPDAGNTDAETSHTGDVTTLDGADPGWHEIGIRIGVDTFGPAVPTATKAAIVTAGLFGNAPRLIGRLRPDLLPELRWSPAGVPSLAPVPPVPAQRTGGTVSAPRPNLVRDGDRLRWVPDGSTDRGIGTRNVTRQNPEAPTGSSMPAAPNAVALADSGLTALGTAERLDDRRTAAYRAIFEENDDGRLRARVVTYQVRETDDGPRVLAEDVAVSPDGELRRQVVSYRPGQETISRTDVP